MAGRPRTLSDEERIENRKKLDCVNIGLKGTQRFKEKIDKFIEDRYVSRNAGITDIIKTHPDFVAFYKK